MGRKTIIYIAFVCAITFTGSGIVLVNTADAQSISTSALIQQLQEQITQLQEQLNMLLGDRGQTAQHTLFTQTLAPGMQSDSVRQLQEFLSRSPAIYPEGLVTGFFGSLTEAAVRRFQTLHNIPAVGIVGPQTRAQINTLIQQQRDPDGTVRVTVEEDIRQTPPAVERQIAPAEDGVVDRQDLTLIPRPRYDRSEIEQRVLAYINEERAARGIGTMQWNDALALVSERHSFDQAMDNQTLTDPAKPCAYPLLRHEGFTFGHTVGDRLRNTDIAFRAAGENLVLFPLTKNLVYRFRDAEGAVSCPRVAPLDLSTQTTQSAQETLLQQAIQERTRTLQAIRTVQWVNREWLTVDEIARRAVDLWLDSPGHRENMLNPTFRESGIGAIILNDYIVITHVLMR